MSYLDLKKLRIIQC